MSVKICEVVTKKDLKTFIFLPKKIHSEHSNWVPPIYSDEWDFYNPKKNSSYSHCTNIMYLAYRDGKPAGRIMGIINHSYNRMHNEQNGRMFAFDCYNDPEVARALTGAVEEWAKKNGMKRVIGPFGFSDKDPQGFMAAGFDEPMIISTPCNLPYMIDLITACGYSKEIDLHEYRLPVPETIPDFYEAIYNRTLQNHKISILEFKKKRELRPYIKPVFELANITFSEIYGFLQLTPGEIDYISTRYLPVINPRFVKLVLDENKKVAAFALAIPEIVDGIRKAKGRLFPFGVLKILAASRRTKRLTMLYGAIRSDLRGNGIDAFMGMKMLQSASRQNFEYIDSHLVLETNTRMLAEYKKLGGFLLRYYRIFSKNLA
jgi:hypothetical protein